MLLSQCRAGQANKVWSLQYESCESWHWQNLYKCWLIEFRRPNSGSCQLTEFLLAMFCSLTEFLVSSSSSESYPLFTWPPGGLSNTPAVELRWLRLLLLFPIGRPLWAPSVFIWDLRRSAMTELRRTSSALIVSLRKVSLRPSTGVPEQRQEMIICLHNKGVSNSYTFPGSLFHLRLLNGYFKQLGLCIVQQADDCESRMVWKEMTIYFTILPQRLVVKTTEENHENTQAV